MYGAFIRLLNMSLAASVIVLVIVILRLLLKKAPKKIICVLWGLVAIRLLLPFSISSNLSAFNLMNQAVGEQGQVEYFQYNGHSEKPKVEFTIPILKDDKTAPNSFAVGEHTADLYLPTVISIWLTGMSAMLLYGIGSYILLKMKVAASIPLYGRIKISDNIPSPFILGIVKPVIYIPSRMDEQILQFVIVHEESHLKRKDHWWKPLGYLLLTVYWFNPILWFAYILLCRDIELACDEKVICDMDKDGKAAYSQALLNCNFPRKRIAACPLAFGEVGVKERVKSVLNYKKPAFWIIVVAVIACVAVAVCFMTNPKDNEPDLSFLNYENACSLAADVIDVDAIYYPPTNKNEDGIICIGYVNGNELAKYLDNVSWQKWNAPQEGLSSPGSIEFCISDDYRITIYQKPRWAVVTYGDEVRYYKTHGGDYEDAVKLFDTGADSQNNVMQATVTEIENGTMLVNPVEGAWELNSSDLFRIPIQNMASSPEPQVGDVIEVEYEGGILETYPAGFQNIVRVEVIRENATVNSPAGDYRCEQSGFGGDFTLMLNPDGTYTYFEGMLSSYIGVGMWTFDGKTIVLTGSESEQISFTLDGTSLVYDKDHSTVFAYVRLPDGTRFHRMDTTMLIDTASFDIDHDGIIEDCTISYGPTSGLFTVVITASVDGAIKYKNTFNLAYGEVSFAEKDGIAQFVRDGEYHRLYVEDNRIVIENLDPQYEGYWGDAERNYDMK